MVDIPSYEIKSVSSFYTERAVKAIGAFFLASATAETTLLLILARIQSHPAQPTLNGIAVIQGMANKVMLQKIAEALAILAPPHHAEIEGLCNKIRKIFEHRNYLAHYSAIRGAGDRFTVTILKLGTGDKIYHVDQVEDYTNRLYQLVRHLSVRLCEIGIDITQEVTTPTPLGLERQ